MEWSDVKSLVSGEIAPQAFQNMVVSEVEQWAARLRERGRSVAITVIGSASDIRVTPHRALSLIDALLRDEIDESVLAYVLDALLLHEDILWEPPTLRDLLETLPSTTELFGINREAAREARALLASQEYSQ